MQTEPQLRELKHIPEQNLPLLIKDTNSKCFYVYGKDKKGSFFLKKVQGDTATEERHITFFLDFLFKSGCIGKIYSTPTYKKMKELISIFYQDNEFSTYSLEEYKKPVDVETVWSYFINFIVNAFKKAGYVQKRHQNSMEFSRVIHHIDVDRVKLPPIGGSEKSPQKNAEERAFNRKLRAACFFGARGGGMLQ